MRRAKARLAEQGLRDLQFGAERVEGVRRRDDPLDALEVLLVDEQCVASTAEGRPWKPEGIPERGFEGVAVDLQRIE